VDRGVDAMKLTVKLKGGRWYATGIGRINSLVHENAAHTPSLRDVFRALEETIDVELPKPKPEARNRKTSTGASRVNTDDDRSYKAEVVRRVFPGLDSQRVKSKLRSASDPWKAVNGAVSDAVSSGRLHRSDKSLAIGVLQEFAM